MSSRYFARVGDREFEIRLETVAGRLFAHIGDRTLALDLASVGDGTTFSLLVDGISHDLLVEPGEGGVLVQSRGLRQRVQVEDERERAAHAVAGHKPAGPRQITAVMPGVVVDVLVAAGDRVEDGQTLVVLEAMKMQNPITADGDAVVKSVKVGKGQAVASGAILVELT